MKIQPNTTISTKFNFKNTYDELGVGKLYLVWKKMRENLIYLQITQNCCTPHATLLQSAH